MTWMEIPGDPAPRTLRRFAGLCLMVFGGLALYHGPDGRGLVFLILALGLGGAGLLRPAMLRPVFVGWLRAVFPVGWVLSRLALGVTYFGLVTPIALVLRGCRRSPLRLDREVVESYWVPHDTPAARYYRQF